jgi:L-aspartate oxidase
MWTRAGLVRTGSGLRDAVDTLGAWSAAVLEARRRTPGDQTLRRVSSLVVVGLLVARAALRREESRGGHFRADFTQRDDLHWTCHVSDRLPAPLS